MAVILDLGTLKMATTYSGGITFQLIGQLIKSLDIGTARLDVNYSKRYSTANGTGADQANMIWTDTRTITASSNDDLDLYGGITNAFGDTMNFAAIKGIFLFANVLNVNDIKIGNSSAEISTMTGNINDIFIVQPGGMWCVYNPSAGGYGVTNTTADILRVTNAAGGTSVDYDIIILGEV